MRSFANPITLRVTRHETRWDAIADGLYANAALNTIKDHHNLIAGAADADTEIRHVLKGLRYANVRLAAHKKGDPTRLHSWVVALQNAVTLHRSAENTPPLLRPHSRLIAVLMS